MGVVSDLIWGALISISPFGEMRLGLPLVLKNDNIDTILAFIICVAANLLVIPLIYIFLDKFNTLFLKIRWYRKSAFWLAIRARNLTKGNVSKYGLWGLFFFVLIPLPGSGAYMGTIAAYILNFNRKQASYAIAFGLVLSAILVTVLWELGESVVTKVM